MLGVAFNGAGEGTPFSVNIMPIDGGKWVAIEFEVVSSSVEVHRTRQDFTGEETLVNSVSRLEGASIKNEARSLRMTIFEDFLKLEQWMRKECRKLWPFCNYCGRRFDKEEVTCIGCGSPRGEED